MMLLKHFWSRSTVQQRAALIVAIPIACLFSSLLAFARLKPNLVEDEAWVQHTQKVRLETQMLLMALIDAENSMRGYGLTRRDEFLQPYEEAIATIPDSLDRLEHLVQDNPDQTQRLQTIQLMVNDSLSLFHQKLTLQQQLQELNGRPERVVATELLYDWLDEGQATVNATRDAIEQFQDEEESLLIERQAHQELYRQITWIVLCISAVIGTGGGIIAIYLFRQLANELEHRQQDLEQTNQQLQQACDQLQRFTANASHELRAPLAAVLSNAQVALMVPEDEVDVLRHRLNNIVKYTKDMGTLVSDLLFLAREEGTLVQKSLQPTDIRQFILALAQEWQPKVTETGHHWQTEVPQHPVTVLADVNLLRQAILNFLSNAHRYTPANGTIRLDLIDQDFAAIIVVEDTGIGIPETDIPHIFERFYRVDRVRSRQDGGFGLGLAIAQHIIHLHHGDINVTSQLNHGTSIQIKLPKHQMTQP